MRLWLRALSCLVLAIGLSGPGRAATDLSAMKASEIAALQKRLTDDGCYAGPIDGQASPATNQAVKACPDQDPMLRIETGTHVAQIHGIAVGADCRSMATGSDDKTVRLWSVPDGRLLQTIRLPIDGGNGGLVNAVAISPDGRTLAAGGWDAANAKGKGVGLYLVDVPTGSVRRIGAFEEVINSIAFSVDGSRIGIGLHAKKGVAVFSQDTGQQLMADTDYGDTAYDVAFGADGSLFSTSFDGFIRRYGADLKLNAKAKAPDGRQPFSIAPDPSGRRIAVGYDDTHDVSILDAASLRRTGRADTRDIANGVLDSVTWTADGRTILAGGTAESLVGGQWRTLVRRLTPDGKRAGKDVHVPGAAVQDMKSCGATIAYATDNPSFGLIAPGGQVAALREPPGALMRMKLGTAFMISADAASVRFGLGQGEDNPATFDLISGQLSSSPAVPAGLNAPIVEGLPVTDWRDNSAPKFKDTQIVLENEEVSYSLGVRADRSGFVLGAGWSLRGYDADGAARWNKPTPSNTYGVNLSQDGKIVVAAYGDGTIRWHRWSDGQELLAFFVKPDTRAWVAWTPSGYYMASPGGEDLIGWQINRGWEQQADFFPASRFRDRFNRPDIVRSVLTTLDEGEAVKQANAAAGRHEDQKPIIERLPPVITILSPSEGNSVAPGMVEVRYSTRMPSGGTVDRVEAFVDGAKIEARGLGPASPSPDGSTVVSLPMPAHNAEISLVAYADGKAGDAARVRLKGTIMASSGVPAAQDEALKPTLYALLIGVTHYETKGYDLAYPAQDAIGLAAALQSQKGRLYKDVVVKVLTDQEATTTAVKRGLSWLRKQTTAHDLAIVFAAGHGTTDAKGKFWFLTYDMDPDDIGATAVSRDDISDVLFDLPGKKLLFLDACHSGAALNAGARGESDVSLAISDFAQTEGGVVAYAASTGREFSFENEQWGHGAFTKALIEGFGGGADLLHKGTITTATLDLFLENRVKELTNGRQHPVMTRPTTVPDFPIAAVQ